MEETDDIMSTLLAAQRDFVRGDAATFTELWSRGADVTIMGAFGGYEQGWATVGPRLKWAASQFSEGTFTMELLSSVASQDFLSTVTIERTEAKLGGGSERVLQELRVTQVFRREADGWKIVHRHADPLRPTAPPST